MSNASAPALETGLSLEDLEPTTVWFRTEVLLAQAETLDRLLRFGDKERRLKWTFAVAYECFKVHPDSVLAILNAARVARAARQFDLAAKLLRIARTKELAGDDHLAIEVQEHQLRRERDIDAGGSRELMAQQLIIYTCQRCGRLTEYISIPCLFCGWQPLTTDDAAQSGRLSTAWFRLWDLLGIGREIAAGRQATEVVSNLRDSAVASMKNSHYRDYILNAVHEAQKKKADNLFYYLHSFSCQNCGDPIPRHNPFVTSCSKCKEKIRMPPPLRLLNGLARVSIHFQHNFGGEQSDNFDLFIRYLISLGRN
jgi:hypothetical protein